jgi:L-cystine transport system ATP-binding protein
MIELNDIHKRFGAVQVLKGIDLSVQRGDVVSILGPSGSGKTTLLRCINFLERPDTGTIRIGQQVLDSQRAYKAQILALRRKSAMVFQQYNLFRHKTALENVSEGLIVVQKIGRDQAKKTALAMLDRVGMAQYAASYPAQLSGGQQQRVGIARSLALAPEVILFDEPPTALDPERVGEVLSVIRDIASDGVTMLIVTHEMHFAREVSNRVVFMENGVIVEQGSPQEIFASPQQERTRQFLRRATPDYDYHI